MTKTRTTQKAEARRDLREEVTQAVIRQLEAGTVPWQKPWRGGGGPPCRSRATWSPATTTAA